MLPFLILRLRVLCALSAFSSDIFPLSCFFFVVPLLVSPSFLVMRFGFGDVPVFCDLGDGGSASSRCGRGFIYFSGMCFRPSLLAALWILIQSILLWPVDGVTFVLGYSRAQTFGALRLCWVDLYLDGGDLRLAMV